MKQVKGKESKNGKAKRKKENMKKESKNNLVKFLLNFSQNILPNN